MKQGKRPRPPAPPAFASPLLFVPWTSLGGVRFGASPQDVAAAWGEPRERWRNFLGEDCWDHGDLFVTFQDGGVVEFSLGPRSPAAEIDGVAIGGYADAPRLRERLCALDGGAGEDDGFTSLPSLGIQLGADDEDGVPSAVLLLARSRWS